MGEFDASAEALAKLRIVLRSTPVTAAEGIDNSYVSQMVTTLAPDIVAAILGDAVSELTCHVTLFDLAVDLPATTDRQPASAL